MDNHQGLLDCIAFMLLKNQRVLAEQRKLTKQVVPGALALPGGHMEAGEGPEEALRRALREALDIRPTSMTYVCTLLHRAQELRKLHYFVVEDWQGGNNKRETQSFRWVPLYQGHSFYMGGHRVGI